MIEILGHFILQNKSPFEQAEFSDSPKQRELKQIELLKNAVALGFSTNSLYTIEKVIHYILLHMLDEIKDTD